MSAVDTYLRLSEQKQSQDRIGVMLALIREQCGSDDTGFEASPFAFGFLSPDIDNIAKLKGVYIGVRFRPCRPYTGEALRRGWYGAEVANFTIFADKLRRSSKPGPILEVTYRLALATDSDLLS